MRIRMAWLCGFVAFVCVALGLIRIYTGASILPVPFNITPRGLLLGAIGALLFGINWSLAKD